MHAHVLWSVVAGFLFGVFVRSFIPLGAAFSLFALLLAIACVLIACVERTKWQGTVVCAAALVAFSGGVMRMDKAVLVGDPTLTKYLDKKVTLEGFVSEEPDVRDSGVRLSVRVDRLVFASTTIPANGGVLVQAPPHVGVAYGERLRATGTLRLPEAFDTGLGRQFHYPEYLAKDGIGYTLAFAQVDKDQGPSSVFLPKYAAIWVKQMYLAGLQQTIPEPEAGLAGGITVGDKRSIGPELSKDFQRVSLIHMVVLSGYNITVVMNFIRWMLQLLPRSLQYGSIFSIVLFFILMAGGAASAVRAGAMALIAVFARATGRVYLAGRILGVVAFCMVLWNPWTLAFDPSFQLSTLATLGLVAFTPLFASRMQWLTERFGLREIAASTLGTQLAVLPLLLYQNGQLSILSLPANLLALLPVPIAMFASFIAAIAGVLFGSYAAPIAFPAYILLAYIIGVAKFFASLPFAAVSVPAFSAWWMFGAYALLFGGWWYIQNKTAESEPPAV